MLNCFSQVWLFGTLWTIALQFLCPWDSSDKNIGVGCNFLLQGFFLSQGLNPHFLSPTRDAPALVGGPGPSNTPQAAAHHTLLASALSALLCPWVDNRSPHLSFIYLFSPLSKPLSLTIDPLSPRKFFSQEEAHDGVRRRLRAFW